jgi:amidophosphoribosyltransferase
MGVDMATHEELIAHHKSVEEIRAHVGVDSLAYLSHAGMMRAVRQAHHEAVSGEVAPKQSHCSACFTGTYPIHLDEWWLQKDHEKLVFEGIWGE